MASSRQHKPFESSGSSSVMNGKSPYYKKKEFNRQDSGVAPASQKSRRDAAQTKLLASVGLDLFRTGLIVDNTKPLHTEARHPAVAPNLVSIPEGEQMALRTQLSHAIVLLNGPVSANLPGVWLSQRIDTALPLHRAITEQEKATCYIIPFGGDNSEQSTLEAEVARNQLVQHGISPHHIVMDCNSSNTIVNAVSLVRVLRHLHLTVVRVVASSFHVARLQHYLDRILGACHDMRFQVFYHPTPQDHLSRQQLADKSAHEQALIIRTQQALEDAVRAVARFESQHPSLPPPGPTTRQQFYT
ncbi:hypothetical protein DYB25_011420 [Aphanomyces astaci]|uniref:DUF218 domain-containing protein n=1 Tax=Aphanomyces astaci TaxID=112090 RepID=A0A397AB79_APHAT|nr:hypothetical protein DYB25_011420 [Aphanomyces astaci]RHY57068.1 hypothetical protein DYB30_007173 [Aphanomyces astaci]RHY62958.1 hypothetical protein DYB38_010269 [Aphanomyces astaci]